MQLATAIELTTEWLAEREGIAYDPDHVVRNLSLEYRRLKSEAHALGLEPIGYAIKTIGQIVKPFEDQLTNLVYDVWNKHSDAIDFRRAFKALLREDAPQAYIEGMREGGIDEPDEEDQQVMDEVVNDWLANQVSFVNDFAQAIFDARKDKDQRSAILDRVTLWVDSLRSIGERGRAYAMNNVKADWQLGDRQTHTQDCIDLSKYKPHRVSWWTERGYIPGNDRHIGCGCRLRDVATGETIMGE